MKAGIILADGFEEMEAMCSLSVLKRGGIEADLYGLGGKEVSGKNGLKVKVLKPVGALKVCDYDVLVLPGGPHYQKLQASEEVKNLIKDFLAAGKKVAAVCASPTILGHMGLLKGKNYTCFTVMDEDFGGKYNYVHAVTDGNIITGRGPGSSIEFALEIVRQLKGEEVCEEVQKRMYYK